MALPTATVEHIDKQLRVKDLVLRDKALMLARRLHVAGEKLFVLPSQKKAVDALVELGVIREVRDGRYEVETEWS